MILIKPFRVRRERFVRFLQNHIDEVVGVGGHLTGCPLANYIQQTYKSRHHSAAVTTFVIDLVVYDDYPYKFTRVSTNKPRWLKEFVNRIDDYDTLDITGREALRILEKIN